MTIIHQPLYSWSCWESNR